jgi:hypothetical protein
MRKQIAMAGGENETPAELKWIFTERVLAMAGGLGAAPAGGVLLAKQMQRICDAESRDAVGFALRIDQQWKRDSGFLPEQPRVARVPQTNRGEARSFCPKGGFLRAQLGDVLAAKNSAVVAQKYDDGRRRRPQAAELHRAFVEIGENNPCKLRAASAIHRSQLWMGKEGGSSYSRKKNLPINS